MTTSPLVSIIIPIYNVSEYLDACVQSALNQTHQNVEVILVNDGSNDNSLDIAKAFQRKDGRVILIDKANGGVSRARNTGLDACHGDYVFFIDGDDFIPNDAICKLLLAMTRDSSVGVALGMVNSCKHNGELVPMKNWTVESCYTIDALTFAISMAEERLPHYVWNKLYRSELLKDVRFIPGRVSEESYFNYEFYCNLSDANLKCAVLPDYVYCYRQNSNSITSTKKIQVRKDIVDNFAGLVELTKSRGQLMLSESMTKQYVGYLVMLNNQLLKTDYEEYLKSPYRSQLKKTGVMTVLKYSNIRNAVYFFVMKYFPRFLKIKNKYKSQR